MRAASASLPGMTITFDHVLVAVQDLGIAAADFRDRYGLESAEGGRHTGLGTANRIIPLGETYIELISVVDEGEAAESPLAIWVSELCAEGDRPAAVCLRTDDVDSTAEAIGSPALAMQRVRPDGVILSWRLCGLEATLADPALPFFIQWDVDPADLPGALPEQHPNAGIELSWVEVAAPADAIQARVGARGPDIRSVDSGRGLVAIGLSTPAGTTVIQ